MSMFSWEPWPMLWVVYFRFQLSHLHEVHTYMFDTRKRWARCGCVCSGTNRNEVHAYCLSGNGAFLPLSQKTTNKRCSVIILASVMIFEYVSLFCVDVFIRADVISHHVCMHICTRVVLYLYTGWARFGDPWASNTFYSKDWVGWTLLVSQCCNCSHHVRLLQCCNCSHHVQLLQCCNCSHHVQLLQCCNCSHHVRLLQCCMHIGIARHWCAAHRSSSALVCSS